MRLILIPQQGLPGTPETALHVAGDVLTIDGEPCDFSGVLEGELLDMGDENFRFAGPVTRVDGVVQASVRVTLGPDAASSQPADPAHWVIDASGDVVIPASRVGYD